MKKLLGIRGFRKFKDTNDSLGINYILPLLTAVKTIIAISSSECERSFSVMNKIVTSKRNALITDHISSLVFINCIQSPVQLFKPDHYAKS